MYYVCILNRTVHIKKETYDLKKLKNIKDDIVIQIHIIGIRHMINNVQHQLLYLFDVV